MKRRIAILISTIFLPSLAFAQTLKENTGDTSIEGFVIRIINYTITFAAALAVLFIVIGGIQYITSLGNEERLKVAKRTLLYAIIGLLLVILSLVIVNIVKTNVTEFIS